MAEDGKCYIGVDLGGTNIQTGILDARGKVLARAKKKTKAELGADEVVKRIARTINDVISESKVPRDKVGAVGIGAPGAIDFERGIVLTAVNLRWSDYPLGKVLGGIVELPVALDNDVNVGAWGEFVAGAGKGREIRDMLGVFVGTGIGGGLILDGKLYHGARQTAGEIGHTVIHADGPLGRRTLENAASRTSIVNLLRQLILSNQASGLLEMTGGDLDQIRSKVLAQAMAEKDPLTMRVLRQAAEYVGIAIANTVTLLSLPMVVLGGGVVEALDKPFVDWVRNSFQEHVFPSELQDCRIRASRLGDDAGLVGAALLAKERVTCGKLKN